MVNYLKRYGDIKNTVRAGDFLQIDSFISPDFCGTDNHKRFTRNLQIQPPDWPWRNRKIKYSVNSTGYRCPEWDIIDWTESILIFGCSQVFGIGVDDADTISANLSRILSTPVINLGAGGSSMQHAYFNAIQYHAAKRPRPKAVINLWTDISRISYYKLHELRFVGSWTIEQDDFFMAYNLHSTNAEINAIQVERASKIIWKNTPYFSAAMFDSTADALGLPNLVSVCGCESDARDMSHIGPASTRKIAEYIAENFQFK